MDNPRNDLHENMRKAVELYNRKFIMPPRLIDAVMQEVYKRRERRAYIRNIFIVSATGLVLIAGLLYMFYRMESLPEGPGNYLSAFLATFKGVEHFVSMPVVSMVLVCIGILLTVEYLMRSLYFRKHR